MVILKWAQGVTLAYLVNYRNSLIIKQFSQRFIVDTFLGLLQHVQVSLVWSDIGLRKKQRVL